MDCVLDHSLAVQVEVEADSPKSRVEFLSQMPVIVLRLHRLLPCVKILVCRKVTVGFLLFWRQGGVPLDEPVEHPPVLSAATSEHRNVASLLDDDVALLVHAESSLPL